MKISIAIPDSSVSDEINQKDKSSKISKIARACAIFKIDEIFIYHEGFGDDDDTKLMTTILKYLETPQYFRKFLYPKMDLLKYSGILYPLNIPSHSKISDFKKISKGDIREGIILQLKGKKFLDIGVKKLFPYYGNNTTGQRVTIEFKSGYPDFLFKEISKDTLKDYWGYRVKERGNLQSVLSIWDGKIIFTSKKGKVISPDISKWIPDSEKSLLLVFGSPQRGLHEILGTKINHVKNSKILNFFPNQATDTVRLEEAIIGVLSIINLFKSS